MIDLFRAGCLLARVAGIGYRSGGLPSGHSRFVPPWRRKRDQGDSERAKVDMKTRSDSWKARGLGPHFRVEVGESSLAVERNGRRTCVPFEAMARVYVQRFVVPPVSHLLHVEIVDRAGNAVSFHASGHGLPDASARTCRAATSDLLRRLAARGTHVAIHEGARPDKLSRWTAVYAVLLGVAGLFWAFFHFVLDEPETGRALGLSLAFFFLIGTIWTASQSRSLPEVSATDLAARLEQL